ncbi:Zinc finger MYND domain-containing protein 12 [Lamellibrachia satsuma]|nr:Zinc finger MYND domain-containing protein 12 [Lamellibrachia satsuma]
MLQRRSAYFVAYRAFTGDPYKPAFIECLDCRVTYYCTKEHQGIDSRGIHKKICQLMIPLRTPAPFLNSAEDRQHHKDEILLKQKQMIHLTRTTGQKLLFEGKHEQAVPAAMQALKFAIDVYGLSSIELVPSYLILGEASIGLGHLSHAEEYLSQAQWTVLKTPECSHDIQCQLHRNVGLLYAAKGDYPESLNQLGNDIYHASEAFGTDDIRTSGGYFHMANVFFRLNKMKTADSLYKKVTAIWYTFLERIINVRTRTPKVPKGVGPVAEEPVVKEEALDEAQEAEAIQVLNAVYDMREQQHAAPAVMAKIAYACSMLYFVLHDFGKATTFAHNAAKATMSQPDDELTKKIADLKMLCASPSHMRM